MIFYFDYDFSYALTFYLAIWAYADGISNPDLVSVDYQPAFYKRVTNHYRNFFIFKKYFHTDFYLSKEKPEKVEDLLDSEVNTNSLNNLSDSNQNLKKTLDRDLLKSKKYTNPNLDEEIKNTNYTTNNYNNYNTNYNNYNYNYNNNQEYKHNYKSLFNLKLGKKICIYLLLKHILNMKIFSDRLFIHIKPNVNYLLLMKVRFKYFMFKTLDFQSRFYFENLEDIAIKHLYNFIILKIWHFTEEYGFSWEDIQEIILSFREILFLSDKPKKIFQCKHLLDNKTFRELSKLQSIFNTSFTEIMRDVNFKVKEGNIISLDLDFLDDYDTDFIKNVNERNRLLKAEDRICLNQNLSDSNFGVKFFHSTPIIIKITKISDSIYKYAFNLDGRLLALVKDTYLPHIKGFKRTWKENSIIFKDDKILSLSKLYKFKPLKLDLFNKNLQTLPLPHIRIGSFDMEVFINEEGYSIVYALGFFSYLDEKPSLFYINQDLNNYNNIFFCLNEMFKPKYEGITWYCHNSGNYDSRILLKVLYEYNNIINERNKIISDYNNKVEIYNNLVLSYNKLLGLDFKLVSFLDYNKKIRSYSKNQALEFMIPLRDKDNSFLFEINTVFRKSQILKLQISKKVGKTKYTITICDSCAILPGSLKELGNKYKVSTLKGDFPHEFVNSKSLFYIGNTPDWNFYPHLLREDYDSLFSTNWNLKEECLKYLSKDLLSLYEIIKLCNRSLHSTFKVQMVNCLTVSKLASDIFLKNFVKNRTSNLPYVNSMQIFNDIHNAYFGGITEVYRPKGENLKYYDVNSLYPFASYSDMPGLNAEYVHYFEEGIELDNSLFGFFYCKIKTYSKGYLGLLPFRTKNRVIHPLGSWEGWYFSEELKFARDNGYSIKVIKGYIFDKAKNSFKSYVDTLSHMKANSKDVTIKNLAKLLLNSLIGRCGMHPIQPITKIFFKDKVGDILLTRKVTQEVEITQNHTLLSYLPGPDSDLIQEFELDDNKVCLKDLCNVDKQTFIKNISIPVAAAVTSYARIFMSKVKLDILKNNGKIFYSDTDSIITDIELDKSLVDDKQIGKFKLEYDIDLAVMPAPKVYCLKLKDPDNILAPGQKIIMKAKGGSTRNLTIEDFIRMVDLVPMDISKKSSITDWSKGTVLIKDDIITLSPTSYISREKIFDENKNWVDTLPQEVD